MRASLLCVLSFASACAALRADEIRWVNPAGGEWNDPANWDLGRVPMVGDEVEFDLDACYSVGTCGQDAVAVQSIQIGRGSVDFDLCGGSLVNPAPGEDDIFVGITVDSLGDGPTQVRFANGVVLDRSRGGLSDGTVLVKSTSGLATRLTIAESGDLGCVGLLGAFSGTTIEVDGQISALSTGLIQPDARWVINGSVKARASFDRICVDGTLEIFGSLMGNDDSSLMGTGEISVRRDSYCQYWDLFDASVIADSGSFVEFESAIHGMLNVSAGAVGTDFAVTNFDGPAFRDSVLAIHLSAGSIPIAVWISSDGIASLFVPGSYIRIDVDDPVEIGGVVCLANMRIDGNGKEYPLPIETPENTVARLGMLGDELGLYLLGVPDAWCPADLDFDGDLDFFDVGAFLVGYNIGSPWANVNDDDRLSFFDVSAFLAAYTASCP